MKQEIDNNNPAILNLRTIILIVSALTTLSVVYNSIFMQVSLISTAIILNLTIQPSQNRFYRLYHRMKLVLKIITIMLIFQVLFRQGGEIIWQYGFIKITETGLNYGISSSLRMLLIVVIAGLLFDIPYHEYIIAFRKWKIPYEISFLVASTIHFIPIFQKQFTISKEALNLRGIELSKVKLSSRIKLFSALVFPVIAKSIYQVKYRSISLELKAFRISPVRTYIYENKLKWFDLVLQILAVCGFFGILFLY
ncbi:MAG: energy-coupling factor transporter transmembrane protein EcfT [Candidatus Cloacimonetes bacterium]|nr:energy-coupling factor transporter transmembrane protein EcfT [Candidatus Cloacimonadota bacterium]